uniref:Protein phosphatase methylesterase 1 n=1 Tax=Moina brachiata TaxID=675436 RepID=A0A4Y7NIL5_9CRUS|nr:EOG090X07NZ [Moina brachiata]SVE93060.1 EOG090X07NZ [Moina brachiata]
MKMLLRDSSSGGALEKFTLAQWFGQLIIGWHGIRPGAGGKREYHPIHWSRYFTSSEIVNVNETDSFRVYKRGDAGPLLVVLHGGGFSALTWALFSECIENLVTCQVLAIDMRGHGESKTSNDLNLSSETLAQDIISVITSLYGSDPPQIVLVGHSMGGAVAVHTAAAEKLPTLAGLVVIDVVEGTAMEALASMQSFLRSRPNHFGSLEQAIEWSVRSGQIRNSESARVSMPGQLTNDMIGECAVTEVSSAPSTPVTESPQMSASSFSQSPLKHGECITEEDESLTSANSSNNSVDEIGSSPVGSPTTREPQFSPSVFIIRKLTLFFTTVTFFVSMQSRASKSGYHWRIDLTKTENHWPGWFNGLSATFLSMPVAKLLLLAGIDRLDRELTVGQMQGKFQMQVLPQCGHAVHEDVPDKVAEVVATFLVRNRLTPPSDKFHWVMPAC